VTSGIDAERYLAWRSGVLAFDRVPLGEAIPDLGALVWRSEVRLADPTLAAATG